MGAVEQEALCQMHAQLLYGLEFFASLDALRDNHRALLICKAYHGLDEVLFQEIRVDVRDERDIELDVVGGEVGDGAEACIPASRIVNGELEATRPEVGKVLLESRVILD